MLNNDKLLLTQGVATIKCQVIVKATDTLPETVLSEENSVKDWTYTDERYVPKQGFIGQFVARTLSGNLQNISDDFNIEGREIELRIGVVSGTGTNWYSLGNFIITDPTDNNVVDNTKFEAMDYTKLFNKKFNGDFKDSVFTQSYNEIINNKSTVTAIWLAKYCCAQVGVEFGQTAFTNSDFIINQNPFLAGETCRDVLKEISKLAYSWVRIGWDNKCYIDFEPVSSNTVSEENIITNNHYYTLETRKELYGPINNVVVGMSGIDGESHSEKDPNAKPSDGEHTIYIYDNPLTNTFELRALAQKKASKLFGLQFAQVSTETIGHPWLQANEKINVKNMENVDNYTYPFNRTIKFTGHIRTTIDSMADSEIEATLAYESEIMKSIKKASATVDKQNGVISLLVEDVKATQEAVENIDGTINPVGVGEGERVYIEDASENELMYLQIDGKSTQHGIPTPDTPIEINSVGYTNLLSELELGNINSSGNPYDDSTSIRSKNFDEVKPNSNYIVSENSVALGINVSEYDKDKIFIKRTYYNNSTFITSSTTKYVKIQYIGELADNILMEEGTKVHPYISHGKYGIEVKIIGKNLFKPALIADDGRTISVMRGTVQLNGDVYRLTATNTDMYFGEVANTGVAYNGTTGNLIDISGYDNIYYALSNDLFTKNFITCFDENLISLGTYQKTSSRNTIPTSSFPTGTKYITLRFGISKPTVGETYETTVLIAPGSDVEYEPYQERISVIELNAPLRSLPNGVKDMAYIRNNKLYVDRYVRSLVLNGTENSWSFSETYKLYQLSNSALIKSIKNSTNVISNYFPNKELNQNLFVRIGNATSNLWFFDTDDYFGGNVDTFKNWLSTHNTRVDYELETSVTEEYELPEKPSTFKGVDNIFINNNPQPKIYVEYVRDNAISKYVEQHVSELRITENEIKASVSSVEEYAIESKNNTDKTLQEIGKKFDNYVTNDNYVTLEKSVTQLQTDTYTKTEINTKLIDGSVTKVMTTSGTFDEDGMHYEKTNAPTSSTINEVGVRVDSTTSGQELLFAGYDNNLKQTIVRTENLTVRKYFVVGDNSRIENYGNGGGIFII